jgi:N-acylneuraminate cytidylyltransferase
MSNIAIITARGGSKRIPKKNIRPFLGKPIIAYSIAAALKSGMFDEVMVSTDSQEIADIAVKYGAKVPFFRSEKNSDDYAVTADVLEEVLLEYKKTGKEYEYICCLYPTVPLVTSERLIEAMQLLEQSAADSVSPVVPFSHPIQRGFKIAADKTIKMIWPENINTRSQDLAPTYYDGGQFYCLNTKEFLVQKKMFMNNTLPLVISELEIQDIDNEEDWKIAELKYKLKYQVK